MFLLGWCGKIHLCFLRVPEAVTPLSFSRQCVGPQASLLLWRAETNLQTPVPPWGNQAPLHFCLRPWVGIFSGCSEILADTVRAQHPISQSLLGWRAKLRVWDGQPWCSLSGEFSWALRNRTTWERLSRTPSWFCWIQWCQWVLVIRSKRVTWDVSISKEQRVRRDCESLPIVHCLWQGGPLDGGIDPALEYQISVSTWGAPSYHC